MATFEDAVAAARNAESEGRHDDAVRAAQIADKLRTESGYQSSAPAQPEPERNPLSVAGDWSGEVLHGVANLAGGIPDLAAMSASGFKEMGDLAMGRHATPIEGLHPSKTIWEGMKGLGVSEPGPAGGPIERSFRAGLRAIPGVFGPGNKIESASDMAKAVAMLFGSGAASGAAEEMGAGVPGQLLAGIAPSALYAGGRAGLDAARRGVVGDADVVGNMDLMKKAGISTPTAGMVTGSKAMQGAEAVSASLPGGAGKFITEAEKRNKEMEFGVGSIENRLAPGGTSEEIAGGSIRAGVEKKFEERSHRFQELWEQKAEALAPRGSNVAPSNYSQTLDKLTGLIPGAERTSSSNFVHPTAKQAKEDLQFDLAGTPAKKEKKPKEFNPYHPQDPFEKPTATEKPPQPSTDKQTVKWQEGQGKGYAQLTKEFKVKEAPRQTPKGTMPLESLRALKTKWGKKYAEATDPGDKYVYGQMVDSLRKDLNAFYEKTGGQANQIWRRGQDHWIAKSNREKEVLNSLGLDTPGKSSEAVFKSAMLGTDAGASKLRRLMNSIPVSDRGIVSAQVIHELGRVKADSPFSLDRFVTQWDNLHPDAKKALFQGRAAEDMETVVKSARSIKESGRTYYNPAGTARLGLHGAAAVSVATEVMSAVIRGSFTEASVAAGAYAGSFALNKHFAKTVHDPDFIRWLAEGTKIPSGEMKRYTARLYILAANAKDPDAKEGMTGIANALSGGQQ